MYKFGPFIVLSSWAAHNGRDAHLAGGRRRPRRRVHRKGLREQSYAVDVAGDGARALYQAAINQYDLVILDVMLPVKNGHHVCPRAARLGFSCPPS